MCVGVVRVVDTHPRVGARRQLLEFLGEIDLAVGRIVGQFVVPQRLFRDGDAIGLGQRSPFVDGAELHVVASLGQHVANGVLVERARVGETGTAVADHPDPHALALRRHEVFDVALVDPYLGLAASGDEGFDLFAGLGLLDHPVGDHLQLALECSHHTPLDVTIGV